MYVISEQNCPTLRFIKWPKRLIDHPEFIRWRNSRDSGRDAPLPYLDIKNVDNGPVFVTLLMTSMWEELSEAFRSDVWTTSITYGKGFEGAADSICKHRVELYKEMAGEIYSGVLIQATDDVPVAILYDIDLIDARAESREGVGDGIHVMWHGTILMVSGSELWAFAFSDFDDKEMRCGATPAVEKLYTELNGSVDSGLVFTVLDNLVFRKYADITVRDARVKKKNERDEKADDGDKEDYIVKSSLQAPINRYDVNWYTETVRSAGFARKAFLGFRWKGPRGHQHRVLVPVRATWVRGYTRRARKPDVGVTLKDFENNIQL